MHPRSRPAPTLAELTTLRVGGPAHAVLRVRTSAELIDTITRLDDVGEPVLLVGGGSNLVVGDDGFAGTVVVLANSEISFGDNASDVSGVARASGTVRVEVGAGMVWDELVAQTVARGLGGLECLSGIPGAVGATPVQNVGAYGVEIADVLDGVQLLDRRDHSVRWVDPAALELSYRSSVLKGRDDRVVVAVALRCTTDATSAPIRYRELALALGVEPNGRVDAAQAREQVLALRRSKGMVLDPIDHDTWSVGSFFTNPVVADDDLPHILAAVAARLGAVEVPRHPARDGVKLSAGWLIEKAGFGRGHPGAHAPVRLSTKHSLAVTNRGTARTEDVLALAREVRDGVRAAFGVQLEPEPVMVGCSL
ncbi:UDP-N-acetylmuramate dehydrogenase [Williamsia sp. CHRR-6]|uniref:UDP-N-acetylmuramate dehydrogenase n=1 Tax=Williamsia sp. CHRR-6 TaxID=2835871 RepID=UPI001BDB09C9|nr:UDP-N-acetylmuramate dehydrogenase [Williamsia sp. CHRR-6]MBT0566927.1 UDP-N-acetylmuramate dehydrogenase [Williamsia sp. CHRR-6]